MGSSTPNEVAPPYEELYSQRPSNPLTGYSRVAAADELDLERDAHQHDSTSHDELNESQLNSTKPHTHCEECDRQLERRERRRSKEHCCTMVSRTFITIALFLMIFGVVAVLGLRKKH
ncbi:uncharacterized protein N7458_006644 [Penicillium daleae]|uniref:Transmembrane protein n=1 Tax=Penicillium daleae TaxID=63821 RepID=A0AAD6C538_9EURO|nr:uncharacterized protein N7458_006644 [Penicillium daleae]KAJ5450195.1 hypothetical protein N7458_006644 [Penicillium daleae]